MTQSLAPGDFDVGFLRVFGGKLDTEFHAAAGRERHHLVGEVDRVVGLFFEPESFQSSDDNILQIGLPDIDHVVNGVSFSKCR